MKNNAVLIITIAIKGTMVHGFINILNSTMQIPVTLINGAKYGKTILITSGIHGAEYPGILTAIGLSQELDAANISGQIIIIHPVNTQGFSSKISVIDPEDSKNINRVFPGDKNGTITDKIAYTLAHDFLSKTDYCRLLFK